MKDTRIVYLITLLALLFLLTNWLTTGAAATDATPPGAAAKDPFAYIHDKPPFIVDLISKLELVKGIYKNPWTTSNSKYAKQLQKTVMITSCNYGFLNHLMNFKCFADALGMKFLVIAMDEVLHNYLLNHTDMVSYFMTNGIVGEVTSEPVDFRSKQFNLITAKKKECVHEILMLGYDVLFTDTDVAMLVDPIPYLIWKNVDYVHSLNAVCARQYQWDFFYHGKTEGNTGFYYVKSNNKTIALWQSAYEISLQTPHLDDQAVFWHVIRKSQSPFVTHIGKCENFHYNEEMLSRKELWKRDPNPWRKEIPLISCMLDNCAFSSGMLSRLWIPEFTYEELVEIIAIRKEKMCAIHANYIKGNKLKMQKMYDHGLWLAIPEPGPGVTYFNNSLGSASMAASSANISPTLSSSSSNGSVSSSSSVQGGATDPFQNSLNRNGISTIETIDKRARRLRSFDMVQRRLQEIYAPTNMTIDFNTLDVAKTKWTGKCIKLIIK